MTQSPCINICRMNPQTGWCEGCMRSIDEIAAWSQLGDEAKLAVWAQLPQRREQSKLITTPQEQAAAAPGSEAQ